MNEQEFLEFLHREGNSYDYNRYDVADTYFEYIDDLLLEDKFEEVNNLLTKIDLEKLSILHHIGLLSVTFSAKSKLPNRKEFFDKIKELIIIRDPTRIEELLGGLD